MSKILAGVFVGVFVGALAYELVKKTELGRGAGKKLADALKAAKSAFMEGYRPKAPESVEG